MDVVSIFSSLIVGLLGVGIGVICTNYFALGRDKRKEFNDIAEIVSLKLKKHRENVADLPNRVDQVDFERLLNRTSKSKHKKLKEAWYSYVESIAEQQKLSGFGVIVFEPEKLKKARENMRISIDLYYLRVDNYP
ncbi:hypothetical protein FH968_17560 [Buttiauxella sp. B2]|uniref:hypothetical protein n=1 Tax=Buttiauxella sp. B2 TaxID=2587812 RepID=UPI001123190D|nr:hypothetical protein [Buttiauxella sp. B2]TNV17867.1 hypothetical protein FH968_17560 [Buttiauxella sp. B2]